MLRVNATSLLVAASILVAWAPTRRSAAAAPIPAGATIESCQTADDASAVVLAGCDEAYGACDCGSSCNCGDACSSCGLLGGLIKPTDACYDGFISPITNPTYFEDPRTLTELRPIFIEHAVPNAAGGGDIQLMALQFRARLTDRLSLIAPKDGYATSSNPLIADGWADVAAGLKYLVYSDPQAQRLLSAGLTFTIPTGTPRTLQARGDGDFHMFLTGGAQLGDYSHIISAGGLRLPADDTRGTQMAYWSTHLDYQVFKRLYVLNEYNWYHWMKSGQNGVPGVEGGDLFNIGSPGVAGNDIVTGALGAKFKWNRNNELGFAWEVPLTDRRDVIEYRLTTDVILRY